MINKTKALRLFVLFQGFIILGFTLLLGLGVSAHQTPSTIMLLDINPENVAVELQLPLSELELAFGHDVFANSDNLVQRLEPQIKQYLLAHIHVTGSPDKPWLVVCKDMKVEKAEQAASGPPFKEITVHLKLIPYPGASTRKFTLDYNVIMHQVINHAAFVSIRNDWETGKSDGQISGSGCYTLGPERQYYLSVSNKPGKRKLVGRL